MLVSFWNWVFKPRKETEARASWYLSMYGIQFFGLAILSENKLNRKKVPIHGTVEVCRLVKPKIEAITCTIDNTQ